MAHLVDIGTFTVGQGQRPFLIAGPCVIESEQLVIETAGHIAEIARALGMPYVFKSSFDKANRTSITSFRGPGLERGLEVLAKVKKQIGVPVLTDVHTETQATQAGHVVDVLQIPAGRVVIFFRQRERGVPFVMPKIQVCLCAIVGDIHLAVLIRVHRAGIDVDIGIKFEKRDLESAAFH